MSVMERVREQATMRKKVGNHSLNFNMGIEIQNLALAYIINLR